MHRSYSVRPQTEFRELKAADEESASLAVLAKALLAEGKNQEAEQTIQEALRLVDRRAIANGISRSASPPHASRLRPANAPRLPAGCARFATMRKGLWRSSSTPIWRWAKWRSRRARLPRVVLDSRPSSARPDRKASFLSPTRRRPPAAEGGQCDVLSIAHTLDISHASRGARPTKRRSEN